MKITHLISVIALSALGFTTAARDFDVGDIRINDAWARPLPPLSTNGAAYLSLANSAMHADRLVSGSSPIAERVEFHTHIHSGSMMMMKRLNAVPIAAHDTVTMAPGGMHVMLVGLKKPLTAGDSFALTLTFDTAGTTVVTVLVEARANRAQMPAMKHAAPSKKHGKATH